ncbi:hypothetical protein [Xylella fastidiosa]
MARALGFAALRSNTEYQGFANAARARSRADWLSAEVRVHC